MARSGIRCWWCMGHLEKQGGALKFRALPAGQRVHISCERDALEGTRKVTAQPREEGVYRE